MSCLGDRFSLPSGWGLVKSSAAELQTEGVKLLQGAYTSMFIDLR